MKNKVVKLTETDLVRIVKKILSEQNKTKGLESKTANLFEDRYEKNKLVRVKFISEFTIYDDFLKVSCFDVNDKNIQVDILTGISEVKFDCNDNKITYINSGKKINKEVFNEKLKTSLSSFCPSVNDSDFK
jgi:hypothetical protein